MKNLSTKLYKCTTSVQKGSAMKGDIPSLVWFRESGKSSFWVLQFRMQKLELFSQIYMQSVQV